MSGFVAQENEARTAAYHKDQRLERAVLDVNRVLAAHEPDVGAGPRAMPTIFVFGLPRSATTLTHQILAWGLDVGYVSNVLARFWLAPYQGAVISRHVLGDERDGSFVSDYGKSLPPAGGHEFAYFWHQWLRIVDVEHLLDFSGENERADWAGAAAAVARMRAAFDDKALVFKTNFAAQFLPAFARAFPMPLFVHARRDPWPVARSILQARRRYYGETSTWWSTHPPDYEALRARSPVQQIAGQVGSLRRAYAAQIAKVPAELVVEVDYEELCRDPAALLAAIRERCLEVHGAAPDLLHPLPARFEPRTAAPPQSEAEVALWEALQRALAQEPV